MSKPRFNLYAMKNHQQGTSPVKTQVQEKDPLPAIPEPDPVEDDVLDDREEESLASVPSEDVSEPEEQPEPVTEEQPVSLLIRKTSQSEDVGKDSQQVSSEPVSVASSVKDSDIHGDSNIVAALESTSMDDMAKKASVVPVDVLLQHEVSDSASDEYDDEHNEVYDISDDDSDSEPVRVKKQSVSSGKQGKKSKASGKKGSSDSMAVSQLRDLPKSVVERAKRLFPDARNASIAVAAYIYHFEGAPPDLEVPDEVRDVAKTFRGDDYTVSNLRNDISDELTSIRNELKEILGKSFAIEIALGYIISDRNGFRVGPSKSPSDLKFLEDSVTTILNQLSAQSAQYRMSQRKRNGRPKS